MKKQPFEKVVGRGGGLEAYMRKHGVSKICLFEDGALFNPVYFPVAAVETHGAVLFADLPGFSGLASQCSAVECAALASHFFAWFEGETRAKFDGIVDKFIGDEVMVVFPWDETAGTPLRSAMGAAQAYLENDHFVFEPRIGIAEGSFAIAAVGTEGTAIPSAMGHTVNLAARCCSEAKTPRSVAVATGNIDTVRDVFHDELRTWDIQGPEPWTPKNMDPVSLVRVERKTRWFTDFDQMDVIRKLVGRARQEGVIIDSLAILDDDESLG